MGLQNARSAARLLEPDRPPRSQCHIHNAALYAATRDDTLHPRPPRRRQPAIEAFAAAFTVIPRTIAENSGLDPIDAVVALKAAHERGEANAGLDVRTGKPADMPAAGVLEPLRVKKQAVASATEAAVMILRIDDMIASSKAPGPAVPPGGMGGMGGMPPGMGEY